MLILDLLVDSLIDNLKILPFLFLTFLLMEYLEDRMQESTRSKLKSAGKFGPILGSVIGVVPQCGFSAAASNLYAGRVISLGTLIAIFLSTSDEMLPIMISNAASPKLIIKVLLIKVLYGMIAGFVIDVIIRKVLKIKDKEMDIHHFCEHEHCECGHGIIIPAIKHTIRIFVFLLVFSFLLGVIITYFGLESISGSVLGTAILGPIICGLIGLIPNCAASVLITKLYLENAIGFGTMMGGLFVGAGVGILVLAKVNENKKENAIVIGLLYLVGIIGGIIINLIMS